MLVRMPKSRYLRNLDLLHFTCSNFLICIVTGQGFYYVCSLNTSIKWLFSLATITTGYTDLITHVISSPASDILQATLNTLHSHKFLLLSFWYKTFKINLKSFKSSWKTEGLDVKGSSLFFRCSTLYFDKFQHFYPKDFLSTVQALSKLFICSWGICKCENNYKHSRSICSSTNRLSSAKHHFFISAEPASYEYVISI